MASRRVCFSTVTYRLSAVTQGTSRTFGCCRLPISQPFQDRQRSWPRHSSTVSTHRNKASSTIWKSGRVAILAALTGVLVYFYQRKNDGKTSWRPKIGGITRPSYGSKEDMYNVRLIIPFGVNSQNLVPFHRL
jgi:hypothetical protein